MGDDKKMVVLGGKRDSLPLIAPRQGRTLKLTKITYFFWFFSGLLQGRVQRSHSLQRPGRPRQRGLHVLRHQGECPRV